ncbi:hypothetical protein N480_22015 [Pseudoalteromonas luteoviolacea S2607]|uniref:GNAT family N-acetyltransferase n=1 Tax=Pseudoalteromonas luteoviolacea TaxID=43657 RepID=UPI0007B07E74|nr:GNAT family N-acetyltransferase [Pseudoalteromonas luteoviolacea]KZN34282.1 hypothetical protein N480_22015 [Pseudoalteromonas luteoviolacea S2607]
MELLTPRLKLRLLTYQDWLFFKKLNQHEQVMQFVADIVDEQSLFRLFESRITARKNDQDGWISFVIETADTNEMVGLHGIRETHEHKAHAEIGFLLHPDFQRKGFARESTQAVIDFAFKKLKYESLYATVTAGNIASTKLLEKLGFTLKETIESNYQINGRWYDDLLFVLDQE